MKIVVADDLPASALDLLRAEGLEELDANDASRQAALARVVRRLASVTADFYARAHADLDAFSPDCRLAASRVLS